MGRGLEALLGGLGTEDHSVQQEMLLPELAGGLASPPAPQTVDVLKIERNPYQPRKIFDEAELDQLSASLQSQGLIQPVVVRRKPGEKYQIVAGERRFRAAVRAGWSEVPVHVLDIDDRQMVEMALTENVHRKDLNPIEKAVAFAQYLETYGGTHDELAKRLELDRSTVSNLMRLLDLPQELQDAVQKGTEKGGLSMGHARALLALEPWERVEVAKYVMAEGWSVRDTENYVRGLHKNGRDQWNVIGKDGNISAVAGNHAKGQSEQVLQLEQDFREHLGGMKVKLTQSNEKGKGKLVISFANHAEFEKIHATICWEQKKVG